MVKNKISDTKIKKDTLEKIFINIPPSLEENSIVKLDMNNLEKIKINLKNSGFGGRKSSKGFQKDQTKLFKGSKNVKRG